MKNNNLMIATFNIPIKLEISYFKSVFDEKVWTKLFNSAVLIIPGLDHFIMVGSFVMAYAMCIWKLKNQFYI